MWRRLWAAVAVGSLRALSCQEGVMSPLILEHKPQAQKPPYCPFLFHLPPRTRAQTCPTLFPPQPPWVSYFPYFVREEPEAQSWVGSHSHRLGF